MTTERRAKRRELLALPIVLPDGTTAVTRNISEHGIYFMVPSGANVESWLSIELDAARIGLRFVAAGEVVRMEPGADWTGVALRLHAPRLSPIS